MGLFDIFKKKTAPIKESKKVVPPETMKFNKMWDLWETGQAKSPYQELMTYQAEVNNGGHSQFFYNVENSGGDVDAVVREVLSILPKTLHRNLEKALSTYKKYNEVDEDKMDDILDTCDDVFYENEDDINNILENYAETIEL